ncbi:rhodanese-like domain-containing protein [Psychromonas sp. MME2]|uniref:rhodanese-like domain-containing protein n=1 Tax=Psychromonas sp. MME2 TaxID=3231033 RepID=UPI00339CCFD1
MQEFIQFLSNNPMLSITWIVIAGMLVHSVVKAKISGFKPLSSQDAILLINKQDAIVVDVRAVDEYKKGHIVDAKNITLSQIEQGNFTEIENKKETPIILVCESGARSSSAANKLAKGFYAGI